MPCSPSALFDDQGDVSVSELGSEVAIYGSLDDGITPYAIASFLETGLRVSEIPCSYLSKGLAGHRQVLSLPLLELTQSLKRNLFGFF